MFKKFLEEASLVDLIKAWFLVGVWVWGFYQDVMAPAAYLSSGFTRVVSGFVFLAAFIGAKLAIENVIALGSATIREVYKHKKDVTTEI